MKKQSYSGSPPSDITKKLKQFSSSSSPSSKSNRLSSPSSSSSSSIKDKTCPICLSQIAGHRLAIISNCNHAYCLRCLLRWSNYKRSCPLCNSHFDSYFSPSSSSSSSFHKHRLLPLSRRRSPDPSRPQQPRAGAVQRLIRRTREEISAVNRQSRPVPRHRSFGRGSVPSEVVAERILQWRASIYKRGLSAVPSFSRNLHNLNMSVSRECVLQRIEPWIQRELQAILQDPDPTIIVHVATSLYLSTFGKKTEAPSTSVDNVDNLAPLRPFLHEWTDVFWHELRFNHGKVGLDAAVAQQLAGGFDAKGAVNDIENLKLIEFLPTFHELTDFTIEFLGMFGKVVKGMLTMDYRCLLSTFKAFAIGLSSFDTKFGDLFTRLATLPMYVKIPF